jgi:adenine deaminase
MKAMIRYSSAWQDVEAQAPAITKLGLDSRHFCLCSDDCHAETLVGEGHMDRIIRHAIAQGIPPMTAIQMSTLNTAEHFGLAREIGQIAPGRWADILIVDDLKNFRAELVLARGRVAAENGKLVIELPQMAYPEWALKSVHLKKPLNSGDFRLAAEAGASPVKVHVIGVIENQAPTRHLTFEVQPEDGEIKTDMERDLAKVAVVERHRGAGGVQVGLVTGFGFSERCAIASTVAHDSHHLIVVGTDEDDMALAANKLAGVGGGQVVVRKGKVVALLELPLAGLMSTERADKVAKKAGAILDGFRACGCKINNPNMTLSLLALPVIPELRISDKGLVDVVRFTFIPVVETARK